MAKQYFNVQLLIKLRLERNLSPDRLAKQAGISNGSVIRDLETGKSVTPHPTTVGKLSKFFGKPAEEFWSDNPTPIDDLVEHARKIEQVAQSGSKSLEHSNVDRGVEALLRLHRDNMEGFEKTAGKIADDVKSGFADSLRETRADVVSYLNRIAEDHARLATRHAEIDGAKIALEMFLQLVKDNPDLGTELWPRIDALTDFITGTTRKSTRDSV